MYDSFTAYEDDFRAWCQAEYPGVRPETHDWLLHILDPGRKRSLWTHQEIAILRCVYYYEILNRRNMLLNIVTGGGKTAIIGAIIAWLRCCHDIQSFLVLCPNTIVRDRLEADFRNTRVFRDFTLLAPGQEHLANTLGLHVMGQDGGPQGMLESGVILGNIQQLYQHHITGRRNLAYAMKNLDRLAVFNDEAHNTPADEYTNILHHLTRKAAFRLDTTATPDRADGQNPDSDMIYHYALEDALAETPPIIKSVVVYQPRIESVVLTYTNPDTGERRTVDEMDEEFAKIEQGLTATQWVTDYDPMRKQMAVALQRLDEQRRRAAQHEGTHKYKPVLFVVAICIADAKQAVRVLERDFKLKGKVLLVTEESDEKDRRAAMDLGKPESPYDAVVSVLMLREGWDVPEVGVILLLRKFSSPVYGQQVVGRGLRRNLRGTDIPEICAIVDHPKLDHAWLWDLVGAKVREDVCEDDLFGDEDLPPRRKPQVLDKPENIIDIPKPADADEIDFADLDDIQDEEQDLPDWPAIVDAFTYDPKQPEIERVTYDAVEARQIGGDDFVSIEAAPEPPPGDPADIPQPQLVPALTRSVLDITTDLLMNAGIGSHKKGYLYGVIMDHIQRKMLGGNSAGVATEEQLRFALRQLPRLQRNFSQPGLVASIVRHPATPDATVPPAAEETP